MGKRKAAQRLVAKCRRKEQATFKARRIQPSVFYSLPDHVVGEILIWIRPKDEDQKSIWRWVCKMSATCVVFRRVMRSVLPEGVPLTPTVFKLASRGRGQVDDPFAVQIMLLNTIRLSDWMSSHVESFTVLSHITPEDPRGVDDALKSFLTSSGKLPKLREVHLKCSPRAEPLLDVRARFLHQLANEHPGLTALSLAGVLKENRYLSSRTFDALAVSLPNLQRFSLGMVSWLGEKHFDALFSKTGQRLKYLWLRGSEFSDKLFQIIGTHCHNLETLFLMGSNIPLQHFPNILCSNKNLSRLNMSFSTCGSRESILDAIVAQQTRLMTFEASYCRWVNNDFIMGLVDSQIEAFGHILLTRLDITRTSVSPAGLRSMLTRWRERTNPGQPLCVRMLSPAEREGVHVWRPIFNQFPEVDWERH